MKYKNILLSICICAVLSACRPQDFYYKDLIQGQDHILPGNIQLIESKSGFNRAEFTIVYPKDAIAAYLHIAWNTGQDSLKIPIPIDLKGQLSSIKLHNLTEDHHFFRITTRSSQDIKSIPISIPLKIYGALYTENLPNRIIKDFNHDVHTQQTTIRWIPENNPHFVATRIRFTNQSNQVLQIILDKHLDEIILNDVDNTQEVSFEAGYLPEIQLLDTLYSKTTALLL